MLEWIGKKGWTKIGGRYVGLPIGFTIKNKPPYPDTIVKAATQDDLKTLKQKGSKHVVEVKKSNSQSNNRSEGSNADVSET